MLRRACTEASEEKFDLGGLRGDLVVGGWDIFCRG